MIDLNNLPKNIDKQIFNATAKGIVLPYQVGQLALGGVIAYILQPGDAGYDANLQKGFVAAGLDQGTSTWGGSGTLTTATATALGTGAANTATILATIPDRPIAASVAAAYTGGGFTDWYLPSKDELNKLFINRFTIGNFNTGNLYWSSSDSTTTNAWGQFFSNGSQNAYTKTTGLLIRPIRSFSEPYPDKPWDTWQTWTKPSGASTAYIVCIGGGGAGGAGASAPATSNRGGGGGGSSSTITIGQVPFYSIPDTLYIKVGLGGIGGSRVGSNGEITYVSCYPSIDMKDCLIVNSLSGSGGGGLGTTISSGSGGSASPALSTSSTTNPRYLSLCNWASYLAQGGAVGNVSASGTNINRNSTYGGTGGSITSGGAGGAGCTSTLSASGGAVVSGDSLAPFLKGIIGVAPNGGDGYPYLKPFVFVGGSGGNSIFNGVGGKGGNGSFGSGGGGGGGGVTGGFGGNGGDGLVMIISY